MRSFAPGFLEDQPISPRLEGILRELGEHKGKEEHYLHLRPLDVRRVLWQGAKLDSVRSSNRIEGLVASDRELRELIDGRGRAYGHSARDLAGYHSARMTIVLGDLGPGFSVRDVLHLYRLLDSSRWSPAGREDDFRWRDDVALETPFGGSRVAWLELVPAAETRRTLEELHVRFEARRREGAIEPLLLVAAYVLDFVMIHPFRTANGRLARLLTELLLERQGYEVGQTVSLERVIEEQLQGYRDAFSESAPGWHHSLHDLGPWWEFLLGSVLLSAYRELEAWANETPVVSGYKGEVVEATIERLLPARFRVRDVHEAYPRDLGPVSRTTVNRALRRLHLAGHLELVRSGRGAIWAKR